MGADPISVGVMMGLSALSSVAGSQAQKAQAQYQAGQARNNQRVALMNANFAQRAGVQKEQSEAWKVRGLIGQQQAAQAANGLMLDSGSNRNVTDSSAALGRLSFGNIRDNTAREVYGHLGQATMFGNEAAMAKASAPTTFDTILGAASSAAKTYAGMGGTNPFASGTTGREAAARSFY
jgi:hypothetical protein